MSCLCCGVLLHVCRWVEEDPKEILQSVYECMDKTCEKLTQLNIDISNIKGICFVMPFFLTKVRYIR